MTSLLELGVINETGNTITYHVENGVEAMATTRNIIQHSNELVPTTIENIIIQGKRSKICFTKYKLLQLRQKELSQQSR